MIFQGLFNILDIYTKEIDLFYDNIDKYFRELIKPFIKEDLTEKDEINNNIQEISSFSVKSSLINGLINSRKYLSILS
jgi:hypothetical protein